MGFDLANLAGKTASTEVTFMGQTCKVTYDPSVLTGTALQAAASDVGFPTFFVSLVKSWDVTRNNRKVPLTEKSVGDIPLVFLRAIFVKILAEAGEGEADGRSSDG